ncbi:hypothetical protein evm_013637 [Chilo suppressalis]|nr:hypothetical protein evm_013637 [Chilo suppressalis]
MDLYNISKIYGSAPQYVPASDFNILKARNALSVKPQTCLFHERFLVKMTPRNFASELTGRILPSYMMLVTQVKIAPLQGCYDLHC